MSKMYSPICPIGVIICLGHGLVPNRCQSIIRPYEDTVYRPRFPSPSIEKLSVSKYTWWRHQMETFSALLAICAGNSPVPGEFPAHRPVTRSFDVFFDLRLNKRLSKQSWGWWFETLSHPLWRHRNVCKAIQIWRGHSYLLSQAYDVPTTWLQWLNCRQTLTWKSSVSRIITLIRWVKMSATQPTGILICTVYIV